MASCSWKGAPLGPIPRVRRQNRATDTSPPRGSLGPVSAAVAAPSAQSGFHARATGKAICLTEGTRGWGTFDGSPGLSPGCSTATTVVSHAIRVQDDAQARLPCPCLLVRVQCCDGRAALDWPQFVFLVSCSAP